MFKGKCILTAVALLCPGFVVAQDPSTGRPQQPQQGTDRPVRQDPMRQDPMRPSTTNTNTNANDGDKILAAWVLSANNNEVALARLAMQRASSNEVRQFAQKMAEEHGALASKLQPLVGNVGQLGDGNAGRPGARPGQDRTGERTGERSGERTGERSGERSGERTGERTGERADGMDTPGSRQGTDASARLGNNRDFDHIALIRELDAKCLESSTKKLSEKSGAEFDTCYMQMQVASHTKAVDMLTVFGNHASPQLKSTLESARSMAKTHLEKAEKLAKENGKSIGDDTKSNEKTDRNPGSPGR